MMTKDICTYSYVCNNIAVYKTTLLQILKCKYPNQTVYATFEFNVAWTL